jgi:hypothetical protein
MKVVTSSTNWFWLIGLGAGTLVAVTSPSIAFADEAQSKSPSTNLAQPDPTETEVIVVVARRRGTARGNPKPIETIDEGQLQSSRGLPISEVVRRLSRDGQKNPRILINGRPADTTITVGTLPSEAIARIEILPPDTATNYGEQVNGRVINIVLKSQFRTTQLNEQATFNRDASYPDLTVGLQRTDLNGDSQTSVLGNFSRVAPRFDKANADQSASLISPGSTNASISGQLQRAVREATFIALNAGIGQTSTSSAGGGISFNDIGITTSDRTNWKLGGSLSATSPSYFYSFGGALDGTSDKQNALFQQSASTALNAQLNASMNATLFKFSQGSIQTSLAATWRSNQVDTTQVVGGITERRKTSIQQSDLRAGVTVPWSNGRGQEAGALSSSLSFEGMRIGSQWGQSFNGSLSWSPLPLLSIDLTSKIDTMPSSPIPQPKPLVSRQRVFDISTGVDREITVLRSDETNNTRIGSDRTDLRINYTTQTQWPVIISLNFARATDTGRVDRPDEPSDDLQLRQPTRYIRNDAGVLTSVDLRTRQLSPRRRDTIGLQTSITIPLGGGGTPDDAEPVQPLQASGSTTQDADAIASVETTLNLSLDSQWLMLPSDFDNDDNRLGEPHNRTTLRAELTRNRSSLSLSLDGVSTQKSRDIDGSLITLPATLTGSLEWSAPLGSLSGSPSFINSAQLRGSFQNILIYEQGGSPSISPQTIALLKRQRGFTASLAVAFSF